MPKFSRKSLSKLETCDKRLQDLFLTVVKKFDCTILEGHRSKDRQNKLIGMIERGLHILLDML